ncbi:PsbP-related protein [Candidatus Chlorohelix sp.]|uniref:PsbP-related protein n=1 Tax=Candidatus Chlorohelix sp. TaxID=3139201 RepID=UPI00303641CC
MIVQQVRTHKTYAGFYLLNLLALALLALAVLILFFFNTSRISADTSDNYVEFRNELNHFSISFPANWQVNVENEKAGVTTITSALPVDVQEGGLIDPRLYHDNSGNNLMQNFSKIDVLSYAVESGTNARDFLTARTSYGTSGNLTELTIDGVTALRLDVNMAGATAGHEMSKIYTSVYLTKNNRGYIIAGFASPNIFSNIVNSFKAW